MNKNVFRALRRECKLIFDEFIVANNFSASKSKRMFKSNLKRFSDHLLKSKMILDPKEFQKHLGVFINICLMKKILEEKADLEKAEEFNELLYSYSHKKFYDYIKVPEVIAIIEIVLSSAGVEGFVAKHPTLSVHRENYIQHIGQIVGSM
uniref:Uncharacterized protein n=1 Tax=Euplotes harpa TaxID=151035 RepID=A0A7S3JF82_9SPIT|mmetsp:Transcript_3743/g.4558  ORF Transcript_3743/g.4558 Transcript_3743/m.4558 type:complete len:150 (+) Transcript_3743:699-1148(+)